MKDYSQLSTLVTCKGFYFWNHLCVQSHCTVICQALYNCTTSEAPCCRYEYHWCDGVHYKKPTALPAPQYITLLMEWVEAQINDENIFPVKVGMYVCAFGYFLVLSLFLVVYTGL